MTPTCYTTKEELALMERQGMGLMYDRLRGDEAIALFALIHETPQSLFCELPGLALYLRRPPEGHMGQAKLPARLHNLFRDFRRG